MKKRNIIKSIVVAMTILWMGCVYGTTEYSFVNGTKGLERRKAQLLKDGHKIVKVIKRNEDIYEIIYREKKK